MEKVAQDEDVSTSRMTFKKRQEEQTTSERLGMLFGKDIQVPVESEVQEKREVQAPYETVEEGLTTDTTTDANTDNNTDQEEDLSTDNFAKR